MQYYDKDGMGYVQVLHDKSTGRDFSVLRYIRDVNNVSYSYVSANTGESEIFYNDNRNKNSKGEWTGYWKQYTVAEDARASAGIAGSTAFAKGVTYGIMIGVAAPIAAELGLFSVGKVTWSSVASGAANFTAQMLTNDSKPENNFFQNLKYKFDNVNLTGVGVAVVMKNSFGAEIIGNGAKLTIENKFNQSYFLSKNDTLKMKTSEFLVNTIVGGTLGKSGDVGLDNVGINILSGLRDMRPFFNRTGIKGIRFGSSYSVNMLLGTSGNVIQNVINQSSNSNEKKK